MLCEVRIDKQYLTTDDNKFPISRTQQLSVPVNVTIDYPAPLRFTNDSSQKVGWLLNSFRPGIESAVE